MATFIDSRTGTVVQPGMTHKSATYLSPLARATDGQKSDVYKLAKKYGVPRSVREWDEYALQYPDDARLVVAGVLRDEAAAQFDRERVADNIALATKEAKKIRKAAGKQQSGPVPPAIFQAPPPRDPSDERYDPDPVIRELAWQQYEQQQQQQARGW